MKDKITIWKVLEWLVILASVGMSVYGIVESDRSNKNRQVQLDRQNLEIEKRVKQKEETERRSTDAHFQVMDAYSEFRKYNCYTSSTSGFIKAKINNAKNRLREWIPKYRQELEESRSKAVSQGNSDAVDYCDKELSRLDKIEKEVFEGD